MHYWEDVEDCDKHARILLAVYFLDETKDEIVAQLLRNVKASEKEMQDGTSGTTNV